MSPPAPRSSAAPTTASYGRSSAAPAPTSARSPIPRSSNGPPEALDEERPFNVSTFKLVLYNLHPMAERVYKWELHSNAQGGRVAP